ncbi:hypothetical protein [Faecalimicrobium dakarense]|uniref:hypothetical protein n=1 Tax=Faecalimicrobium dakarense TaxID=1301100 RepID=UPI0004AFED80|nr:hypothetical protein [[Clostridium] dakarense]
MVCQKNGGHYINPKYSEITGKDFYLITAAGDTSKSFIDIVEQELEGFTSCLDGGKTKGIIYGVGACDVGDIRSSSEMKRAFEMGKNV